MRIEFLGLLVVFSISACDKASAPEKAAPHPSVQAAPKPSAAPARKQKQTAAPSKDQLGTLPEGVGVPVGQEAPSATVQDFRGKEVELSKLWAKGPVLLVFYRGGWCPYCNFQVRELTRAFPKFRERKVTPVLVSVDRPSESAKTQAAYEIPFPVLSDPELALHKAYQVLNEVDDETLAKYEKFGVDLEAQSGQKHHTIAVPAVFLVDSTGVVRWAHADKDYKVRPSTEQLLAAIDHVQAKE